MEYTSTKLRQGNIITLRLNKAVQIILLLSNDHYRFVIHIIVLFDIVICECKSKINY